MDTDLYLTVGVVLAALTIPSLLSAWTEVRPPRIGAIMLIAAGALIVAALTQKPGGYTFAQATQAMASVVGRYLN